MIFFDLNQSETTTSDKAFFTPAKRLSVPFYREKERRKMKTLISERGAITAEYAIATLAGVAFAGLMLLIMRSEEVRQLLFGLVARALGIS